MQRVRCITKDEINLIGMLYGNKDKNTEWNIIIPGVDGNIMTNEFIAYMGEYFEKENKIFLLAHHRGSFQIISSNSLDPNIPGKTVGSVFEKFDDSIYDIEAWIEYAIENGAQKINLLGHSHGCNKLINYLATNKKYDNIINKFILISPLDLRTRMNRRKELDDLYKIANEKDENKFVCCGFFYKEYSSFYDMMENPHVDNFPMMSDDNNDFSTFNSINKDKYIVYGSDEIKYIKNFDIKKKYLTQDVKAIDIIEGGSHIYQGKEKELAEYIINIIK